MRWLFSGALAGLSAAAIAAAGASTAPAAEPGVVLSSSSAAQIADVRSLGTHWVRMFATWPDLEPARGVYAANWFASYEQTFQALPPGTKVILDVVDTPRWETGSSDEHMPPANPNDYAALLGMMAQRYAGRVSAYEIWNEEDEARWWTGAPNPAAYAQLLKATYPAVKAADPKATVVLGGLTGNDYPFLQGVYQAGGKGSFDAVGVHTDTACDILSPYDFLRGADNRMIPDSFLAYREVRATMLANGDDVPIWMTELSWRTTGATCQEGAWAGQKAAGVTDEQQATYLNQAYHCLAQDPYVQVALWYPVQDEGTIVSGLVRANGSRKPSFAAMQSYASQGDQLTEPCGVVTGPKITIASPGDQQTYTGPLPIHVFATSSEGVFRLKFEIDGKLIRNYGGPACPSTLAGLLDWQGAKHISYGRHTLTFLAFDKEHNISQMSITIYHGSAGGNHHQASKPHQARKKHHRAKKKHHRAKKHHRHGVHR